MAVLKEITKLNGLTLKQLSIESQIPYTTLASTAQKPIHDWSPNIKSAVAGALKMDSSAFESAMEGEVLSPFIKWVGGERQLLPSLVNFLPEHFNHYYEPFVGGGALFLRLAPRVARINDFNEELTNTWQVVKNDLAGLKQYLQQHQINDSKEYYLNIRSADRDERLVNMTPTQRAARFIYLNKAGYNGLWRVNSHGQNNVPYGSHKTLNLLPNSLDTVSKYLNHNKIEITTGDYQKAVKNATKDDLVYFDPPYVPVNLTSSFTTYTKTGFGQVQQEQLRNLALKLAKNGIKVMLSNSDTELVHQLYADPVFRLHEVQARRYVNSNAKKRGNVGELIITTY